MGVVTSLFAGTRVGGVRVVLICDDDILGVMVDDAADVDLKDLKKTRLRGFQSKPSTRKAKKYLGLEQRSPKGS